MAMFDFTTRSELLFCSLGSILRPSSTSGPEKVAFRYSSKRDSGQDDDGGKSLVSVSFAQDLADPFSSQLSAEAVVRVANYAGRLGHLPSPQRYRQH